MRPPFEARAKVFAKARTEKATVRILRVNTVLEPLARGVLVPGGYILTAAHCINWDGESAMAQGLFRRNDPNQWTRPRC
jgi:secreted trypsin-like serine protease